MRFSLLGLALVALSIGAAACATNESNMNGGSMNSHSMANTSPSPMASMPANSNSMSGMDHGSMKSSPNAASAPYDLQFIDTMSAHHQSAIDMAKMAQMKAQHAELKQLANKIIEDQQKEIAQMKSWRDQWFAGKPQAMNMEMPGMMNSMNMDMSKMNNAIGNEFDMMFIDMMSMHHQGAVTMARQTIIKAEHPEIKKLAQAIITSQEAEIKQMQAWKTQWASK